MFSKLSIVTVQILLVCSLQAFADSATQSDWSDGGGVSGPVSSWEESFYGCDAMEWSGTPGSLFLSDRALVDPTMHCVAPTYTGAGCLSAGDLDGDGDIDIICGSELNNRIDWWENSDTEPGTFVIQNTIDPSVSTPVSLFCIDLEFDGDIDVLGTSSNSVLWWENNGFGSGWTKHTILSGLNGAEGIHAADVDGDGDLDISATEVWSGGTFFWFENLDSTGTSWASHSVLNGFYVAYSTYLEDIDGDGDIDMLAGGGDGVYWFENIDGSGSPPWTQHDVDPGFSFAISLSSLDFDGDGDMDLAGADYTGGALAWWENIDGAGANFNKHSVTTSYQDPSSVHFADFDSDGDLDLLSDSYAEDNITIWQNLDGNGQYWAKNVIWPNFINPGEVFIADLNDDGFPDALASAYTGGEILWWEVSGSPLCGFLESTILYLGNDPGWGEITWSETTPSGTSVSFLLRSSDDPDDMGTWSDTVKTPGSLFGLLGEDDSYIQYSVILETDTPSTTPVLEDICVNWNSTGCSEEWEELYVPVFSISPNPAMGAPMISYEINGGVPSEITVFDISGRVQYSMQLDPDYAKTGSIQILDLIPGVYLCRLLTGETELSERFVVLR